jgi:hypothetical protein
MTVPTPKVEIALGSPASFGTNFVLNDPVKGVLDNTTYTLSPESVWVDVSADVVLVATVRGANRELDQQQTGQATIVLRDQSRTYDNSNTGSPYYPNVVPMRRVRITIGGLPLFAGFVQDWVTAYDREPSEATVTVKCVDAFAVLAATRLSPIPAAFSGDTEGERITRVLDDPQVRFPASRSIATGLSTMGPTTYDDTTLSYLQKVAANANGWLYVAADGTLTYANRRVTFTGGTGVAFSDDPTDVLSLAAIPYSDPVRAGSADLLYNRVVTSAVSGNEQVAEDPDSEDDYLVHTLTRTDSLLLNDLDAVAQGQYLLGRYSQPTDRFVSITVELDTLTPDQQAQVLALDITAG